MSIDIKNISLSLHIPISPNLSFYSRILWIRKSLDSLGSPYNSAKLHISVSNEDNITEDKLISSFDEFYLNRNRYEFYITDKNEFCNYSYGETAGLRYLNIDNADVTIFCDSDIIFVNRIDDLIEDVLTKNGLYGVIAHYSPFIEHKKTMEDYWNDISLKITKEKINLENRHSLNQTDKCPAYYNNGFVIGDFDTWNKIKQPAYNNFKEVFDELTGSIDSNNISVKFFTMQISLALILNKLKISTYSINEIYNCANQNDMLGLINNDIRNIRVIHYLRDNYYDRDFLFQNINSINSFIGLKNVDIISEVMQEKVDEIIKIQGYK